MQDTGQPILVVIGDETVRRIVGWILAELDLPAQLVESWQAALVSTNGAPACIVADLDDVADNAGGVNVLRKAWAGAVPLLVLSRNADVCERAVQLGAVAGVRKPFNAGDLLGTLQRLVPLRD
jgi:FixJ family two-component response regulator